MDGSVREGRATEPTEAKTRSEAESGIGSTRIVASGIHLGIVMMKTGKEGSGSVRRSKEGGRR